MSLQHARTRLAALLRWAAFFALWVILTRAAVGDLAFGAIAAAAGSWASLRLLPPGPERLRFMALVPLAGRFLWQSVVAGWDVARRVFDPRLPIKPGFVSYPVGFAPGPARNAFTALTSLLPGTVPAGEDDGRIVYHCLDVDQPVLEQLAAEEAGLRRVIQPGPAAPD